MATMNISLPDSLKQFVDEEVQEGGFASTSDYMRDLGRKRQHEKVTENLRNLIAEGLASTSQWWIMTPLNWSGD